MGSYSPGLKANCCLSLAVKPCRSDCTSLGLDQPLTCLKEVCYLLSSFPWVNGGRDEN